MSPSSNEAKLSTNSSLDDALGSLTDALLTLRRAVDRSQQVGSHAQKTAQTLAVDAADELRSIKSLIFEACELIKDNTTSSSK